ncbi:MAG: flagellar biosynthesis protein FlhA [Candidatus Sericytochromatia bacterium]|nr:flagellar biosynthesis protein FlhA [Candidatus Sericytochromatia bacterium]
MERLLKQGDIGLAVLMIVIISFMMVPLPTWTLDLLLTLDITLALMILMVALYVERPLDFSTFPTVLLVMTLLRLALNISSTRLILTQADAGKVIETFGSFVIGGNYIVGVLIFVILVVVQFVVITNGAGRISEVAARFTLDAMPGKQMAIDADLNSGLIDEDSARQRRSDIQREADFYGSMDGASKFVRGDAIAGIIITFINILGGIMIGAFQRGMSVTEALERYTVLTIGDGLVSQIPAMVIAIGTGVLVSRAAGESQLGERISRQLVNIPRGLLVIAFFLLLMGVATPLPKIPFILIASLLLIAGVVLLRQESAETEEAETGLQRVDKTVSPAQAGMIATRKEPEDMIKLLKIDPIELEIGYRLIPLVDAEQGGDLLERITKIRRQMALQLGLVLPAIRVRDNIQLKPRDYAIKMRGVEIARGEIHVGHFLAMSPGGMSEQLEGIQTVEPVFNLPAVWVSETHKERAEMLGYTVFDPSTVVATHLTEIVKRHAADILTRQDVQRLIDNVREEAPAVVDELIPALLSVGEVQGVLQNLLRERVSIRDMIPILEALANHGRATKEPDLLTEHARQALARSICQPFRTPQGQLPAMTLSADLEQILGDAVMRTEQGLSLALEPHLATQVVNSISRKVEETAAKGYHQPVLICSSKIRLVLRRLTERSLPILNVLSYNEVMGQDAQIQTIARIDLSAALPGAGP